MLIQHKILSFQMPQYVNVFNRTHAPFSHRPNFLLTDITEKGSSLAGITHIMDYAGQTTPILFSFWFPHLLSVQLLTATMLTSDEKNIYLCKCALSLKHSSNLWSQGHQWCVWQSTKQKFYIQEKKPLYDMEYSSLELIYKRIPEFTSYLIYFQLYQLRHSHQFLPFIIFFIFMMKVIWQE